MKYFIFLSLFLCLNGANSLTYFLDAVTCQNGCQCQYDTDQLYVYITCNTGNITNFFFPLLTASNNNLRVARIIIASNNKITALPGNICDYANTELNFIDLSVNFISNSLTRNSFGCISKLATLNLSSNRLQTLAEDTFDNTSNLITLDLSKNLISTIPVRLFAFKLPMLRYLYLQFNRIIELDAWFFRLGSILRIDLSNNQIRKLSNNLSIDLADPTFYPQLKNADFVDLRNNSISIFDDSILKMYKICDSSTALYFFQMIYSARFDSNPFVCNCGSSFNLLQFYSDLLDQGLDRILTYLSRSF